MSGQKESRVKKFTSEVWEEKRTWAAIKGVPKNNCTKSVNIGFHKGREEG